MIVGELFVNIAIKGANVAAKSLGTVGKAVTDVSTGALAAKAALLGVIIGLERLTGISSQVGLSLHNYKTITSNSTDELQRWQQALSKVNVPADEVTQSMTSMSLSIQKMQAFGEGAGLFDLLSQVTEGFDSTRLKDTSYVLGKIEEALKRNKAIGIQIAQSFGLSNNMIQGLITKSTKLSEVPQSKILSPKEIESLTRVNELWRDIWNNLQIFAEKVVAAHGEGLVTEVKNFFDFVLGGLSLLDQLITKFSSLKPILATLGVLAGIFLAPFLGPILGPIVALQSAVAGLILVLSDFQKFLTGKDSYVGKFINFTEEKMGQLFGGPEGVANLGMAGAGGSSDFLPFAPSVKNSPDTSNNSEYNVTNSITVQGNADKETVFDISDVLNKTSREMPRPNR